MRELTPGAPAADALFRAADVLYDAGAAAVWLFGSRARSRAPDRRSDFDLCVEGLPDRAGTIERASRELRGRVDIVRMELATPPLRCAILQNRILVPRIARTDEGPYARAPLPDSLAGARTHAVAQLIRDIRPRSVIDFGCGAGSLLAELAADALCERITGVDFDQVSLSRARKRIARVLGPDWKKAVELREGLVTHRDPGYIDHDAAAAVEVIEHLEPPQLDAFVGVLFQFIRPLRAVLTTPNVDYNIVWFSGHARRRHPDHRFEWSRAEFAEWANRTARAHGYDVTLHPVGPVHVALGAPTQLASFDKK
jgi:2-polyprenyl-3-methyl-5-hydroxy-6-metoxy-1,4-benzoquinol methylase